MPTTEQEVKRWVGKAVNLWVVQDKQDIAEDDQVGVVGLLTDVVTKPDGNTRVILDNDLDEDGFFNWSLAEVDYIEDADPQTWSRMVKDDNNYARYAG